MTDLPPLRILTNENADSYFDFDIESPGSPIDECEYTRLIESTTPTATVETETKPPTQTDGATESGFVCASPTSTLESVDSHASASSSEAQFFDPETSISGAEYFDCQDTGKLNQIKHQNLDLVSTSSSSSSSKVNGHKKVSDDSCDSLPSSVLTISSDAKSTCSNSTLQDQDTDVDAISADLVIVDTDLDGKEEQEQENNGDLGLEENVGEDEEYRHTKYNVAKTKFIKYNEADDEDLEEEENKVENENEVEKPQDPEVQISLLEVSNYEYPIEMKTEMSESTESEVITEIDAGCCSNTDLHERPELKVIIPEITREDIEVKEEEDEEKHEKAQSTDGEEDEKPQRIRRCSSLKTGRTKCSFSSYFGHYSIPKSVHVFLQSLSLFLLKVCPCFSSKVCPCFSLKSVLVSPPKSVVVFSQKSVLDFPSKSVLVFLQSLTMFSSKLGNYFSIFRQSLSLFSFKVYPCFFSKVCP